MTLSAGYALAPGEALEHLDMGAGRSLSLKVTTAQSGGLLTVLEGVVLSGGPPLHVHEAEDEVVVVLEGELDYQVGGERGSLSAGGLLWLPRGVPHTIASLAGGPCRFVTVVTPSGIEGFFRDQRDVMARLPVGTAPTLADFDGLSGAVRRPVVGPPLTALA